MTDRPLSKSAPERGHVKGLDGIRGLAALMVFAEHQVWLFTRMSSGRAGVELFFVLSGYLIVGILSARRGRIEAGGTDRWSEVRRFFLHRAFRIFPAYYLFLAVMLALGAAGLAHVSTGLYSLYLTYTTNLGFAYHFHGWPLGQNFGHLWSLAVEEQFYCLAAPLFLLTPTRFHRVLCAGFVAVAVSAVLGLSWAGVGWTPIGMDSAVNFGYIGLGGLVSHMVERRPGRRDAGLLAAVACGGLVMLSTWFTRGHPAILQVQFMAMGLAAAGIIASVARNQEGRLVRALEHRWLRALGRISYGFYLYQAVIRLPPTGITFKAIDLIVVANLAATVLAAQVSWMLLEGPMLKLRDRLPAIGLWSRRGNEGLVSRLPP